MTEPSKSRSQLSPTKQALLTIGRLERELERHERRVSEPIAIVGMACRFAGGASSPEAFWQLLRDGRDAIRDVPADRFDLRELYDEDPEAPGKMFMRRGAFLNDIDGFDATFFRISPREAAQLDPQQRLFLEVGWEALENAGIPPSDLRETQSGVFAGVLSTDYDRIDSGDEDRVDAYYYTGVNSSFIAGRLSHFLGARGPSVTVDAACSSSLVAVHLACQSLRSGESDVALAGGVNLILSPEVSMFLCKAKAMSPSGICRAFDKDADGLVRGEGCGIVVLKRLSDAIASGDDVLAVIRGTASNHNGASPGLTVPSPEAQEGVYRAALANAGIEASSVSYIEAHGTGTKLGDPIELSGLAAVYCADRDPSKPLLVGSVKTNIGHTDSAAGIAGLIKAVLVLRHREIPPSLNFREPNPHFPWDAYPLAVARERRPLPTAGPLRVGVSSFGLSGVNAHAILERFTQDVATDDRVPPGEGPWLLPLSAKTTEALEDQRHAFRELLASSSPNGVPTPYDVCRAAAVGRTHLDSRAAAIGESAETLRAALDDGPESWERVLEDQEPRIAFVFSGQGPQWWAMGRELYSKECIFRNKMDEIDALFSQESGWSLLEAMRADETSSRIDETEVAQPAMFAIQVSLAALLRHWGIEPHAIVGLSMGEAAACATSGALNLDDAVRVIYHRGRLLQGASGRMLAVSLSFEDATDCIAPWRDSVSIAVHNGPRATVLSGEASSIRAIAAALDKKAVYHRDLHVKFASHCPEVERYLDELEASLTAITPRSPNIPIVSTVTGETADVNDYSARYWTRNVREPVQFSKAFAHLLEAGLNTFVEIDPHPVLAASMSQCLEAAGRNALLVPTLHRDKPERQALLETLASLYVNGLGLDFRKHFSVPGRRVALPNYPWQKRRHWLPPSRERAGRAKARESRRDRATGILGSRVFSPLAPMQFASEISSAGSFGGHRISGRVVFPAAGYIQMAVEAAGVGGLARPSVHDMSFLTPLVLSDESAVIHTVLEPAPSGRRVRIFSTLEAESPAAWDHNVSGILREMPVDPVGEPLDLGAIRARGHHITGDDFYERIASQGYEYADAFRRVEKIWVGNGELLSQVAFGPTNTGRLDACLHSVLAAIDLKAEAVQLIPKHIERLWLEPFPPTEIYSYVRVVSEADGDDDTVRIDIVISDDHGRRLGEITGLSLARVRLEESYSRGDAWCYGLEWELSDIDTYRSSQLRGEHWVIFADEGGVAERVALSLHERSVDCTLVRDERVSSRSDDEVPLDARSPEPFLRLFESLASNEADTTNVLYLWGLDSSPSREATQESFSSEQERLCGGLMHTIQALVSTGFSRAPRLFVATRGTQKVGVHQKTVHASPATLWGLTRVAALEHPELQCALLDLDPDERGDASRMLLREVSAQHDETQIAFRRGERYVARLVRHRPASAHRSTASSVRLASSAYGLLENLELVPLVRRAPGPGAVEIRVHAAGLNFRDVLSALGLLKNYEASLGVKSVEDLGFGFECSGTITRVGAGVDMTVGDPVIAALTSGSLGAFVHARAEFVVPKPEELSFEQAATVPIAFLTASYALEEMARIRQGDRVLIHSAAGGVGQAAIQIAQSAGAEVFATASRGKWELLKSLGVAHVFDSRSTSFAERVMDATGGDGVDVVLNSLTGELLRKSFDVCRHGARFVEIGKTEVLDESEAKALRPDVVYSILDVETTARAHPEKAADKLTSLVQRIRDGALEPIPHRAYQMEDAAAAFRDMANGKHVGKLVITMQPEMDLSHAIVRPDACYLITGGLGALGLKVARRLAEWGARYLVLVGRSAPSDKAKEVVRSIQERGVDVTTSRTDVSDPQAVEELFSTLIARGPALRGIIHAAAVLDDGVIVRQDLERFQRVLAPKAYGAWNVHRASAGMPLDFFVCFSSTVALLGSPGQANYAAANTFLDALVSARRAAGEPGVSISWGPWAEVGLAAKLSARDRIRWTERGVEAIPIDEGLELMGRLLASREPQVAVLPVDWDVYIRSVSAPGVKLFLERVVQTDAALVENDIVDALHASPVEARRELLRAHVRDQIARVLSVPVSSTIGDRQRLFDLGLDSLMALQVRNRLSATLGQSLSATLLFDYPTVRALVEHIASDVLGIELVSSGRDAAAADSGLDDLSEDQLAELLARELSQTSEGSQE